MGTVQKIVHHDAAKKSPFLSIYVNWDNGEKEYLSPWDLEALDADTSEIGNTIDSEKYLGWDGSGEGFIRGSG